MQPFPSVRVLRKETLHCKSAGKSDHAGGQDRYRTMPQGMTSLAFPPRITRFDTEHIFIIKKTQHQCTGHRAMNFTIRTYKDADFPQSALLKNPDSTSLTGLQFLSGRWPRFVQKPFLSQFLTMEP